METPVSATMMNEDICIAAIAVQKDKINFWVSAFLLCIKFPVKSWLGIAFSFVIYMHFGHTHKFGCRKKTLSCMRVEQKGELELT